jgi:hypothetical protein
MLTFLNKEIKESVYGDLNRCLLKNNLITKSIHTIKLKKIVAKRNLQQNISIVY